MAEGKLGVTWSFNGRFRDECLNQEWFRNRREARAMIENWRQHYNEVRPHSSLGYKTPNEFRTASNPNERREAVLQ
jgi:putative transposase